MSTRNSLFALVLALSFAGTAAAEGEIKHVYA